MLMMIGAVQLLGVGAVIGAVGSAGTGNSARPHIITHLVDDMGWYDVQPRNPNATMTGHFAELAEQGILLLRHHSFKMCSPTRR